MKPLNIIQEPSDLLRRAQPAAVGVNIHHVEVRPCARLKRFFVVVERNPRQPAVNDDCLRINFLDRFIGAFEELRVRLRIRIRHPETLQVLFVPDFPVLDAILKVRNGSAHIFEPGLRMVANRACPGHRVAEDHEQLQAPPRSGPALFQGGQSATFPADFPSCPSKNRSAPTPDPPDA